MEAATIDAGGGCVGGHRRSLLSTTAVDVDVFISGGRIASLIGMRAGNSINNSLATFADVFQAGARYMTLTHTTTPDWADAAGDEAKFHG